MPLSGGPPRFPPARMKTRAFIIRKAVPEDAETLCHLIRELAEYERLADEADPDAASLGRHLSEGANPPCRAFLAVDASGTSVGFALFFQIYSTFLTGWGVHLEDLYVKPPFRGQGIGETLLKAVARDAVDHGCDRLELSVLDWNTLAVNFYLKRGARSLDDWTTMRFTGTALRELARQRK